MITKRIIPCLDVRDGRVVKGVNFKGVRDVDDPVELAKYYNDEGADELVFYDITASVEERPLFSDILRAVASSIFIPLTVGGSINALDDFDRVLKAGADKVSVNSAQSDDRSLFARLQSATATSASCCPWTLPAWVTSTMCSQRAGAKIRVWTRSNGRGEDRNPERASWCSTASRRETPC